MKIVKAELEDGLHSKFKTWAFSNGKTMSGALVDLVELSVSNRMTPEVPPVSRNQAVVKPEQKLVEVVSPASSKTPVVPTIRASAYVDPPVIPMAKCRKCFETFPVADMVTDPKSGKLFCGWCVENMRNQQ